jgi:hypothetical protein
MRPHPSHLRTDEIRSDMNVFNSTIFILLSRESTFLQLYSYLWRLQEDFP